MADRMLEHLDYICLDSQRVRDLEAGTGYAIPELQRRFGTALEKHRRTPRFTIVPMVEPRVFSQRNVRFPFSFEGLRETEEGALRRQARMPILT